MYVEVRVALSSQKVPSQNSERLLCAKLKLWRLTTTPLKKEVSKSKFQAHQSSLLIKPCDHFYNWKNIDILFSFEFTLYQEIEMSRYSSDRIKLTQIGCLLAWVYFQKLVYIKIQCFTKGLPIQISQHTRDLAPK